MVLGPQFHLPLLQLSRHRFLLFVVPAAAAISAWLFRYALALLEHGRATPLTQLGSERVRRHRNRA